jgi:ABC-type multidrug transport system ATPase subunit
MISERPIAVTNLTKRFGRRVVLDRVSLDLGAGTALGLVGLNGAGKTTFMRLLLGLLRPEIAGTVSVLGHDPWRHGSALFRRLGVVLEHDGFEGNLDFAANIGFYAAAKGVPRAELDAYIGEFWSDAAIVADRKPVKHFSRGQRMQCALCRAFLGRPSLILLDEPTVALDIEAYDHFGRLTREAVRRGGAVLISSHALETIEDLCDGVAVLHEGKLAVRSLTDSDRGTPESWGIAGGEDPRYASVISETTGATPVYAAGEWSLSVKDADATIPLLVRRLTEAGLEIRHVAKKRMSLREMLRKGGAKTGN